MGGSHLTYAYDQATNNLIDASNVAAVTVLSAELKIFRGDEHFILRGNVYSDASTSSAANLSGLTFSSKIGSLGTTAIISCDSSGFNNVEDWSLVNVSSGSICFVINSAGSIIDTDLGTKLSKTYYCHIQGKDGDGDDRTIALFPVTILNTPD